MTDLSSYDNLTRTMRVNQPQSYSFLPKTFIKRIKNPENFLPRELVGHFNEKMFYFNHRECFNNCVDDLENAEECYRNCQDKRLTSLQIFKTAVEEKRKWSLVNELFNLREYQKRPKEMGKNVPSETDYYAKLKYIEDEMKAEKKYLSSGLNDLFSKATNSSTKATTNIFKLYLSGVFPPHTQKAIERNNVQGRYEEYLKLNEQYGKQVDELLNSAEPEFTWGHIDGEDYE